MLNTEIGGDSAPHISHDRRTLPYRAGAKYVKTFIHALSQGSSVSGACTFSGMPRQTAYDRRELDETFRAAWDAAIEAGTEKLEDEAYRRAHDGVQKPVVYQGQFGREDDITFLKRIIATRKEIDISEVLSLSGTQLDLFALGIGLEREILFVREPSDTLMAILLKARRPEVYRERTSTDVNMINAPQTTVNVVIADRPIEAMHSYQKLLDIDE